MRGNREWYDDFFPALYNCGRVGEVEVEFGDRLEAAGALMEMSVSLSFLYLGWI